MDKVIEKFVEENQVMGFVYIIKSDAGGGVDEDRVSGLLGWGEWFIEVGQVDYQGEVRGLLTQCKWIIEGWYVKHGGQESGFLGYGKWILEVECFNVM